MKISWQEIRHLEDFLQNLADSESKPGDPWDFHQLCEYFAQRPHLFLVLGFDEYVNLQNRESYRGHWFDSPYENHPWSLYRRPSGQWLLYYGDPIMRKTGPSYFSFHTQASYSESEQTGNFLPAMEVASRDFFMRLYKEADKWQSDSKTLWHPRLWTPDAQQSETNALARGARGLLAAIRSETKALSDISWQQLEEIVAEVLRAQGLEIHVVKERPQGGRDIIARGELLPGQEPLTMAVEVKHRASVDRPEVQKALWQNRHYPSLLFITSGRFTAGVLEEKALPENHLRLFLKDGEALGDLIRRYPILP